MTSNLSTSLLDEELEELDQFLRSDARSAETMFLDTLDGYLTAIAIGPTAILPSGWLPGVWGPSEEDELRSNSMKQPRRILALVMRHMNSIAWALEHDPDAFDPLIKSLAYIGEPHEYLDGAMWAHGFMEGIALCREDWQPLFDDPAAKQALRPIYLLRADEATQAEQELEWWSVRREVLTI